jgi:hypothetical protein
MIQGETTSFGPGPARRYEGWTHPQGRRAARVVPTGREGRQRLASLEEACRELRARVESIAPTGDGTTSPSRPADHRALRSSVYGPRRTLPPHEATAGYTACGRRESARS